ncbi:calcium-dependent protein kinase 29-like [Olea europaea var. sylvestris]|uniref:calcium-dependent protein kinase 29-like n=1 Tax=Olea europaea var. sylvestris TaxID=158386 RepID=UPI000C1D69CD|nr:calcium-dependent protein kinase 29-like [Olea europaea var. sylvestris]
MIISFCSNGSKIGVDEDSICNKMMAGRSLVTNFTNKATFSGPFIWTTYIIKEYTPAGPNPPVTYGISTMNIRLTNPTTRLYAYPTSTTVHTAYFQREKLMTEALRKAYTVKEEIGRGKYGVVFRCHSAITGDCFAVKSIDKRLVQNDAVDRQCLYNEAKIMQLVSSNNHPNVLKIFDIYEDDSFLHIILEYCQSSDLFDRINARPIFTESEALDVMGIIE